MFISFKELYCLLWDSNVLENNFLKMKNNKRKKKEEKNLGSLTACSIHFRMVNAEAQWGAPFSVSAKIIPPNSLRRKKQDKKK